MGRTFSTLYHSVASRALVACVAFFAFRWNVEVFASLGTGVGGAMPYSEIDLQSVPPVERLRVLAPRHKLSLERRNAVQARCDRCMLKRRCCICSSLAAFASRAAERCLQCHFVLRMHVRERFRASNTGKLISQVFPNASTVLLDGIPEDERRLEEIAQSVVDGRNRGVLLFPSEGALPLADALTASEACEGPLYIFVIDGTWKQAKRLVKHKALASVPRVKLAPESASRFTLRRQSQPDRISTVEAVALLLQELGGGGDAAAADLMDALSVLEPAVWRQSGRVPNFPALPS